MKVLEFKTINIHTFKTLIEGLKELTGNISFVFTKKGIMVKKLHITKSILIEMFLEADKFEDYRCDKDIVIGFDMINLYKVIKTCVNSNILHIYYDDETPSVLNIDVENEEKNYITKNKIYGEDVNSEERYADTTKIVSVVNLPTIDFQKIIKDSKQFESDTLEIAVHKNILSFKCKSEYTIHETLLTGELREGDGVVESTVFFDKMSDLNIRGKYKSKFLYTFTKFSNLCKILKLSFDEESRFIQIKYNVGELGTLLLTFTEVNEGNDDEYN